MVGRWEGDGGPVGGAKGERSGWCGGDVWGGGVQRVERKEEGMRIVIKHYTTSAILHFDQQQRCVSLVSVQALLAAGVQSRV